jgi:hypothetical protein
MPIELGAVPFMRGDDGALESVVPYEEMPPVVTDDGVGSRGMDAAGAAMPVDQTVALWSRSVAVEMSVAGIPVLRPTEKLLTQYPGRRWNFMDFPWTASTPAHACVLLSAEQLAWLENNYMNTPLGIVLTAFANDDHTEVLYTELFSGWYLDRAIPLYGQHIGDIDYNFDSEGANVGERPEQFTKGGLWEVHLKDERAIALLRPVYRAYNVVDAMGRRF